MWWKFVDDVTDIMKSYYFILFSEIIAQKREFSIFWFQKNLKGVSRDIFICWIFFSSGINVSNSIIADYVCQMHKQPSRSVLEKRSSENMQQIYRITPMLKCDFSKVALQLYWNHTLGWVIFCKFANTFLKNTFGWLLL